MKNDDFFIAHQEALFKFVFGFDDVKQIYNLYEDPRSAARFVFYCPDISCFNQICKESDFSILLSDARVRLLLGEHSEEELLREMDALLTCEYIYSISYTVLKAQNKNTDLEKSYREMIAQVYHQRETEMATYRYFGTLPCRNELFALSVLYKSSLVSALFEKMTDRNMPVVLVGAGPSLAKNVKELREVNNRALIVCASHSLRIMQKEGIVPDLIAEIDPKDWSFLEGDNTACHLLISSQASLEDQKQYIGRSIYFSFDRNIFPLQELREEPLLSDNSGSVLTEVFELFLKYGFSKYILLGQDLAYSKEGNTHAGGEYQTEIPERKHFRVPGKHGDFVESRYDWIRFRDYYESQIMKHPEITVLDATAEGARIKGAKVISLSDALNEVCSKVYPISEWLRELPRAQSHDSYICLRDEMKKKTEELKTLILQIPRALMDNRKIQTMIDNGQMNSGIYTWICSQYDSKYHQILDSDASKLLLFYCEGMLQDYIANKLSVEAEDRIREKLILEEQLFTILEEKSKELVQYMEELWTN